MILPVLFQGRLFLGAAAAGFALALFYDIFRLFRRIIPHSGIFIHIEDIVYWIIVVAIMFYFLLTANSGEIRLFSIAGTFIGMFAYFKLASRFFLKLSLKAYNYIRKFVILLIMIISAPFRALFHVLSFPAAYVTGKAKTVYEYEKKIYRDIKIKGRLKGKKVRNNLRIIVKKK